MKDERQLRDSLVNGLRFISNLASEGRGSSVEGRSLRSLGPRPSALNPRYPRPDTVELRSELPLP